jgi:diketogulonate reductase-like aldo/keto reductase
VRAIGVSNYTVELLREMEDYAEIMPAVNQVEFHPYIFQEHQEIVEYCTDRGIIFEAYSPLAKGRWFDDTVIERIASDHGKTSAQVMLRWCIQHGTVPIPKSAHPQRIRENFEVFDFSLNPQDMEALDKLG